MNKEEKKPSDGEAADAMQMLACQRVPVTALKTGGVILELAPGRRVHTTAIAPPAGTPDTPQKRGRGRPRGEGPVQVLVRNILTVAPRTTVEELAAALGRSIPATTRLVKQALQK